MMGKVNLLRSVAAIGFVLVAASNRTAVGNTAEQVADCRMDAAVIRDALREYRNCTDKTEQGQKKDDIVARLRLLKDISQKIRLLDSKFRRYGVTETAAWPDRGTCVAQYLSVSKEAVRIAGLIGVDIRSTMTNINATADNGILAVFDAPAENATVAPQLSPPQPLNSQRHPSTLPERIDLLVAEMLAAIGILIYVVSQLVASTSTKAKLDDYFKTQGQTTHQPIVPDG